MSANLIVPGCEFESHCAIERSSLGRTDKMARCWCWTGTLIERLSWSMLPIFIRIIRCEFESHFAIEGSSRVRIDNNAGVGVWLAPFNKEP